MQKIREAQEQEERKAAKARTTEGGGETTVGCQISQSEASETELLVGPE